MIEVLVTLVILSIGLLGLAALQLTGLRSNSGAGFRSIASMLATDIADRMRANPTAVNSGSFANVSTAAIACGTTPVPYCSEYYDGSNNQTAQTCTPAQLAAFDINVWYCGSVNGTVHGGGIANLLPAGASATIVCNAAPCTPGSQYTITINWTEVSANRNSAATGQGATTPQQLSLTVLP